MAVVTVNDLLEMCNEQVSKGNGKKKVYISRDDEGNGFHALYYGFTEITPQNANDFDTDFGEELSPDEHIALG